MDIDIEASLRSLEAGIGLLPSAFIAVALLGGPTVIWVLYRFVVQPRTSRYRASQIGALWICTGCRSANELAASHCYRCHREFEDVQVELIDPASGGMVTARLPEFDDPLLRADRPPEPGRDITAIGGRAPVAVGPGKPTGNRPGKSKTARPSTSKAERSGTPNTDRPVSPKSERAASADPDRPVTPKTERAASAKAERPSKPKADRPRRAVAAGGAAPKRAGSRTRTKG